MTGKTKINFTPEDVGKELRNERNFYVKVNDDEVMWLTGPLKEMPSDQIMSVRAHIRPDSDKVKRTVKFAWQFRNEKDQARYREMVGDVLHDIASKSGLTCEIEPDKQIDWRNFKLETVVACTDIVDVAGVYDVKEFVDKLYDGLDAFNPLNEALDQKIDELMHPRYEECYQLNDIWSDGREIFMCARVSADKDVGKVKNKIAIVDRESGNEGTVNCVHTAIYSGIIEEPDKMDLMELAKSSENKLIGLDQLDAEEHFLALRSYVAGIAEMGLKSTMLRSYFHEDFFNPDSEMLGFNDLMQSQIMSALEVVDPDLNTELRKDIVDGLTERVPPKWFEPRLDVLNKKFGIKQLAAKFPDTRHRLERIYGKNAVDAWNL